MNQKSIFQNSTQLLFWSKIFFLLLCIEYQSVNTFWLKLFVYFCWNAFKIQFEKSLQKVCISFGNYLTSETVFTPKPLQWKTEVYFERPEKLLHTIPVPMDPWVDIYLLLSAIGEKCLCVLSISKTYSSFNERGVISGAQLKPHFQIFWTIFWWNAEIFFLFELSIRGTDIRLIAYTSISRDSLCLKVTNKWLIAIKVLAFLMGNAIKHCITLFAFSSDVRQKGLNRSNCAFA